MEPPRPISDTRYLWMVCIAASLFLLVLVVQDQERHPPDSEYLQIAVGEGEHASYLPDPAGTALPPVQVEVISEVIWDEENSATEALARFATVETNLLTPVPLISNRFASPTPTLTPTVTRTPTPTATPTRTPSPTSTPDPCTHGYLDGTTWVVGLCDNFWYISWQTGYVYEDLIAANPGISQYDLILPGQFIRLPKKTPGPTATPVTPTVTPFPTLSPFQWHVYLPLISAGD